MKFVFYVFILAGIQTAIAQNKKDVPSYAGTSFSWHHDYHQTLVMKIMNCVVDKDGSAKVICNFEKTLTLIKDMDNMTLGVPKILYLVGWQYNGHDDLYPAFFEVNNALKRTQDKNGLESLNWLVKEAKKYHTTISLHINMTDAYDNSPLWNEYIKNDLISKNEDGSLKIIGNYNDRKAYQINYRNEWTKGFAQKRVDQLISLMPWLKDAGTIHLDAWIARDSKGHGESVETEREYQKKVGRYWLAKGIEPTNEVVFDYLTGLVPYAYHFNYRTQKDYLDISPSILTGTHMNPDVSGSDFGLQFLFGTSTYGETSFPGEWSKVSEEHWEPVFKRNFFLNFPQYHYLNRLERLKVEGEGNARTAYFSGNVRTSLTDSTVYENLNLLRKGNTICFPATWAAEMTWVAYSTKDTTITFQPPQSWLTSKKLSVFEISKSGLKKVDEMKCKTSSYELKLRAGVPLCIRPKLK
ncbi:endo-alpha-N-acetylgalactosaminidase family protein [Pedobacter ginsengisoli]|uniref:endo-alpha-N-acetylgalactosaminidase family protein n=1 Tax=Pedobacter ginsengisoli TaxID=363852 RepID=UPI00254FB91B|nr:endo-alpha-N-acetylgalactosaminidase family protein [Pedobacter ginsengisoli]